MRLPSLAARFASVVFRVLFLGALLVVVLASGCGRSSLEIETPTDGGVTPGNCTPSSCPTGCCDSNGTCRVGTDIRACGTSGGRCSDCVANGFEFCDGRRVCGRNTENCFATCSTGCCDFATGVGRCLAGDDGSACGRGGVACTDCSVQGRDCDPVTRSCGIGKCDATNCSGCCVGDICLPGDQSTSCGTKGEQCRSCASQGQSCQSLGGAGGVCVGTPTCGPANCAGCCQGTTCVVGSDATACGNAGQACTNCTSTGRICGGDRTCQTPVTCSPANCPGCCVGNACIVATTPAACGKGGEACRACGANESCNTGTCVPAPACSAANCAGCCIGTDVCAVGAQNTACGVGGAQCTNCTAAGRVCQTGTCQVPTCGPANCAGCCSGNTCVLGTQDNACGGAGAACSDCTPGNQVCQGRVCQARCGPTNCTGCCTTGNACAVGFANGACGSGGAACSNCTAGGFTCNTLANPRVCSNVVGTCPSTYGGCAGATTPIVGSIQNLCDALDLDALQAACAGGPDTGTCAAALATLAVTNGACRTCLTPFLVPFARRSGVYTCVAPFATAECNGETGCAIDCSTKTCAGCAAGVADQCFTQVSTGAQCSARFALANTCANTAGPNGSLCNPATYGNQYGPWLRAVGDHFCGDGP